MGLLCKKNKAVTVEEAVSTTSSREVDKCKEETFSQVAPKNTSNNEYQDTSKQSHQLAPRRFV